MILASFLHAVLNKLRGPHRSIRFRFWEVPKENMKILIYRLRGRSWIDYYSDRMANHDSEALPTDAEYLDVGKEFLSYLTEHGLLPEHRLLDYGCGILRGGLFFIPYLNPGNYVGVDISAGRLAQGRELMRHHGIPDDRYETYLVRDCSLKELKNEKFDYVWAHAVLMHMPEADIRHLLFSLKHHMAENSSFFFTYFPSEKLGKSKVVKDQIRDFYYPTDHLRSIFDSMGYEFTIMPSGYREKWGIRVCARLKVDTASLGHA